MTSDRVLWTSRRSVMCDTLLYGAQYRYVQVTRWAHEYNDFRLKMAATGLPSSGENTPIDTPPRQAVAQSVGADDWRQSNEVPVVQLSARQRTASPAGRQTEE